MLTPCCCSVVPREVCEDVAREECIQVQVQVQVQEVQWCVQVPRQECREVAAQQQCRPVQRQVQRQQCDQQQQPQCRSAHHIYIV